jgi:hypothetical protein
MVGCDMSGPAELGKGVWVGWGKGRESDVCVCVCVYLSVYTYAGGRYIVCMCMCMVCVWCVYGVRHLDDQQADRREERSDHSSPVTVNKTVYKQSCAGVRITCGDSKEG